MLLKPPRIVEAEVFSRAPDALRKRGVVNAWARLRRGGEPTHSFLEGPVFDAAGDLFTVDVAHGRIFRIDADGRWNVVAEYEGEPHGLKFIRPGVLAVADFRNGLLELDVASGRTTVLLDRWNGERLRGPNDLTLDEQRLYFTDQGDTGMQDPTGRVFRLDLASGRIDRLLSNAPSPNGLVLSPDRTVLFVAMTRSNAVWRAPLTSDGGVGSVGQFFTSHGPSGPDGLAMDAQGRLIVCNPGLGCAWVLDRRGEPEIVVTSPVGDLVTNVALRTHDGVEHVYLTEAGSGSILRAALGGASS